MKYTLSKLYFSKHLNDSLITETRNDGPYDINLKKYLDHCSVVEQMSLIKFLKEHNLELLVYDNNGLKFNHINDETIMIIKKIASEKKQVEPIYNNMSITYRNIAGYIYSKLSYKTNIAITREVSNNIIKDISDYLIIKKLMKTNEIHISKYDLEFIFKKNKYKVFELLNDFEFKVTISNNPQVKIIETNGFVKKVA